MALTSWKTFNFFDVSQVTVPDASLLDTTSTTAICSGSESLFLGTSDGQLHILSSSLTAVRTFAAYEAGSGSITRLKQIEGTALLVTIAEDLSSEPQLKVWALDKVEKKTGAPKCLSSLGIQNGRRPFPITAFAVLEDLSQLAIGFGNGAVTVVRGDLINDRGAKQRTVFESEEPITGLEFREGKTTTLYLSTTGRILTLTVTGKGQGQPAKPLEDIGCAVGCMTIDKSTGEIVVARDDAVTYYGLDGKGPSFAYEGPKQLVRTFNEYVGVVSPPQSPKSSNKRSSLRFFGGGQADEILNTSTFTLLDTDLKYVAHRETISAQIDTMFAEWGDLFLLTQGGKLFRYHEKTLQQKLEILYSRNLYVLAINFAQKANLDLAQRNVILRRYGDYLYQKGDYDTAMQQYLKAIDNTEPSQVIRKFLDTQRIQNLIQYLEELHEHDKATIDHTTLLLNCYAKLKDTAKLENFIRSGNNFDFDTAIMMCRQGGYHEQAVFLAKKHGEHALVVDILVEDSKEYDAALDYIWRLEPDLAYPNLMKYARTFLEHCPKDATQIFVDYYTGNYRHKSDQQVQQAPQLVPNPGGSAIQGLTSFIPLPYRSVSSAIVPVTDGQKPMAMTAGEAADTAATELPPRYAVPNPRTAFSAFVDHPQEFIVFIESCLEKRDLAQSDAADLYTALFEMYLELAKSSKSDSETSSWESKARHLIDGKSPDGQLPIDPSNILLLSHLSSFRDGTILVREQQGLRSDIFRSYTSAGDTQGAIKALHKYGPEEPSLYPAALAYFTSSEKHLQEAGEAELSSVLHKIDQDGLLAPLQVVQMLGKNDVAKMGMIRDYLRETVERERKDISSNRRLADAYRKSTQSKRDELKSLGTVPTSIQNRRCASCGNSLDLPAVHYLCKHSFHQRCLNVSSQRPTSPSLYDEEDDGEVRPECPVCQRENETIRAIRRAQEENAGRHELFLDALGRSRDKLATVSEFFGRGVLGSSRVGE